MKSFIKHHGPFVSLVLLGALCLFAACSRDDFSNRKHVATVNGEKIYLDEYQERLKAQKGTFSPDTFSDSLNKQKMLEDEILESLITEKIVLQRARELNLSVSNTELEQRLLDIRKDYGVNFFDLLIAQNVRYEDWREEIGKKMLWEKLVAADVNASIRVSESEAEDYYQDHPGLCKREARVRAAQIVVQDPAKAGSVKKRLENGEDFAAVAAQISIGPEAARGGDLGFIAHGTMPEPLDKTLFSLPVGVVSPIVKSAYGYHIFKLKEIQPGRTRSFAECREDVMAAIRAQKEEEAFAVWLNGLKVKAVVKKEARALEKRAP